MYRQANINSNVKVKNIANIFQSINTRNKPAFINNNYIHLAPKTLHAGNRHVMNGSYYGTTFFFITFVVVCISFVFSFCWSSLRISILEAKGKNWALILVQMFSFEIVSLIINSFCISLHDSYLISFHLFTFCSFLGLENEMLGYLKTIWVRHAWQECDVQFSAQHLLPSRHDIISNAKTTLFIESKR